MPPKTLTLKELEELLSMSADLVDELGEECQPLLDYWEKKYLARRKALGERERIAKLLAEGREQEAPKPAV